MADLATIAAPLPKRPARAPSLIDRKIKPRSSRRGLALFFIVVSAGVGYIVFHLSRDLETVKSTSAWPQFPYHGGIDHRRGAGQPTADSAHRHLRRGLGAGDESSQGPVLLASDRVHGGCYPSPAFQVAAALPVALSSAHHQRSAAP